MGKKHILQGANMPATQQLTKRSAGVSRTTIAGQRGVSRAKEGWYPAGLEPGIYMYRASRVCLDTDTYGGGAPQEYCPIGRHIQLAIVVPYQCVGAGPASRTKVVTVQPAAQWPRPLRWRGNRSHPSSHGSATGANPAAQRRGIMAGLSGQRLLAPVR